MKYGAILPNVPSKKIILGVLHTKVLVSLLLLFFKLVLSCDCLLFCLFVCWFKESSLRPMSCDVVVVGGGTSGMYMAETLMRMKKEDSVCLFEKDSRFGGRNYDIRFSQAPNISIGKLAN